LNRSGIRSAARTAAAIGVATLTFAASALSAAQPPAIEPWQALTELRLHLAASGAVGARFHQSYVPAGFATGDEESGRVALALPDCLRWDYSEPYPKAYLLCGERLHTWVSGEPQGERLHVEARDEAGLDLLLLPVEQLRQRYRASARSESGGAILVELVPTDPGSRIAQAEITFDLAAERPTALSYRDRDGNRSTFRFETFELLDDPALFTPPASIVWKEP
jgi:outer membrane lipoprotein-sorting protein